MNQNDLPSDVPVPQEGFGLFARAVGGFMLGSGLVAVGITLATRPQEVPAGDEGFQTALFCDVGGTLMAGAIIFSVLGTVLSRSHHAQRARGWGVCIGLGALYPLVPTIVLWLLAMVDFSPGAQRAVTLAHMGYMFAYPAIVSPLLIARVRQGRPPTGGAADCPGGL